VCGGRDSPRGAREDHRRSRRHVAGNASGTRDRAMEPFISNFIVIAVLVLLAIGLLARAIRIIPEYQRIVVFRLGRVLGAKGPGLVLLIPIVDRGVVVDLRERFFDVQPQTTITADNAYLSIDFLVYSKIVDALLSVLNVE